MALWIAFAVLTAAVLAAVLRPLMRNTAHEPAGDPAVAVYRHQLEELQAEQRRGLLDERQAAAAWIEVSRRLLAAAEKTTGAGARRLHGLSSSTLTKVLVASAALVPMVSIGLYLAHGSPDLPSRPFAQRAAVPLEQAPLAELIARVEARLAAHPDDGQGWDVIAPVYLRLGRFADAAEAYARAADLLGETAKRLSGFANATVLANNGIVTEDARRAYEKVLALEPGQVEARFWLALAKEQDGRLAEALADYRELLKASAPGAPLQAALSERIDALSRRVGGASPSPGAPK
jgi:cytochrome c-type biogenesis protein CcmH